MNNKEEVSNTVKYAQDQLTRTGQPLAELGKAAKEAGVTITIDRATMPGMSRLMEEVEEAAQAEYKQIMADIAAGKTTLEEEKRKRGII